MASKAGRWLWMVLGLLLCVALAGWGVALLRRAPAQRGLTERRVVPVRTAAAAAAERAPVRLHGTLVAMPALQAPDGREYALQRLEIEPPDGAAASPTPAHARPAAAASGYRRVLPSQVFLSDGDSVVAVEPSDVDAAFLPLVASGETLRGGALPPEVAMHVAPVFGDLPRREGARVALHGIRTGEPVAAYGTLVLREGVPSLVRPTNGDPFVLTTMTLMEVERELRRQDRLGRLAGWALLGLGGAGAALVLALAWRRSARGWNARNA